MSLLRSLTLIVVLILPSLWYNNKYPVGNKVDLNMFQRDIKGWTFKSVDIEDAIEKLIKSDKIVNGMYTNYEKHMEINLFVTEKISNDLNDFPECILSHTPDRCWPSVGWKVEEAVPNLTVIEFEDHSIIFERRIFSYNGIRQLVYFTGLLNGQQLPFRLNHNYKNYRNDIYKIFNEDVMQRLTQTFKSRLTLKGKKNFIRFSTEINYGLKQTERDFSDFISSWFVANTVY